MYKQGHLKYWSDKEIDGHKISLIDEWYSDDGDKLIRFFVSDGSVRCYVVRED